MARFRFNLETVLRVRRIREDECKRDMAQAIQERVRLEGELRAMQQTIVDSKRSLGSGLMGMVDLEQIGQFARYAGQVSMRAQAIVVQLAGVEKQIAARRDKLLRAVKARRALELLRERRHTDWLKDQDRREAAVLDEFGAQTFIRQQDEEAP